MRVRIRRFGRLRSRGKAPTSAVLCVRLCKAAGVLVVTAHGMRGTHATLATERGVTGHVVAAALGHESPKTTYQSYAKSSAVSNAKQRKVIEVLDLSVVVGNDSSGSCPQQVPKITKGPGSSRNPS